MQGRNSEGIFMVPTMVFKVVSERPVTFTFNVRRSAKEQPLPLFDAAPASIITVVRNCTQKEGHACHCYIILSSLSRIFRISLGKRFNYFRFPLQFDGILSDIASSFYLECYTHSNIGLIGTSTSTLIRWIINFSISLHKLSAINRR